MSIENSINKQSNQAESFESLQLPETIIVTSGSAIKIETVRTFLQEILPGKNFNVVGVKANSGVNEQPVGDETEQGARNRIESAESLVPDELATAPKAFVSIENGIFQMPDGTWEDKAVAVIKLPNNRIISALSSQGVVFPQEAVAGAQAKEGGFKDHTVGSVIAEMYAAEGKEIDKQDPHSALTNGAYTREQQMKDALRSVLTKALG